MKSSFQKAIAAIIVIGIIAAFYYREAISTLFIKGGEESGVAETMISREGLRKISTTASYKGPTFEHTILFDVYVDEGGVIQDLVSTDKEDPTHDEKLASFSEELLVKIAGKKLSEVGPVDKVGTSSYTTEAFNKALVELKEQL